MAGCAALIFPPAQIACIVALGGGSCIGCAIGCIATCFSPETQIILEGTQTPVFVGDLRSGDKVLTIVDNGEVFTEVLFAATHTNETIEFIRVTTPSGELTVTVDHGLLIKDENGMLMLIKAGALRVGDELAGAKGELAVLAVRKERRSTRVTVATKAGTILANGVLASTICGTSFNNGQQLQEVLPGWLRTHGGDEIGEQ